MALQMGNWCDFTPLITITGSGGRLVAIQSPSNKLIFYMANPHVQQDSNIFMAKFLVPAVVPE